MQGTTVSTGDTAVNGMDKKYLCSHGAYVLVGEAGNTFSKLVPYSDCRGVVSTTENGAGQRDWKCCLGEVGGLKF